MNLNFRFFLAHHPSVHAILKTGRLMDVLDNDERFERQLTRVLISVVGRKQVVTAVDNRINHSTHGGPFCVPPFCDNAWI